jgi:hypothetical protein
LEVTNREEKPVAMRAFNVQSPHGHKTLEELMPPSELTDNVTPALAGKIVRFPSPSHSSAFAAFLELTANNISFFQEEEERQHLHNS